LLHAAFTATLQKSPAKGGWTYVVWPEAAMCFGTHKLPVKADVRKVIGKQAGDEVTVHLKERLEG
jgi:Domain of unknown function (DUF1905)